METEKEIEQYLVKKVKELGGRAYKFISPGNAGVPDRLVILPRLTIFVELKTKTGQLSQMQKVQIRRLKSLGQPVQVIRSKKQVDKMIDFYIQTQKVVGVILSERDI